MTASPGRRGIHRVIVAYGCGKDSLGPMVKGYGIQFLNQFFRDTNNKPISYQSFSGQLFTQEEEGPNKKEGHIYTYDVKNIAYQVRREGDGLYLYRGDKRADDEPLYRIRRSTLAENQFRIEQFRYPHDCIYYIVELDDFYDVHTGAGDAGRIAYTVIKPKGDSVGYVLEGETTITAGKKLYVIRSENYSNVVYNLYHNLH